MEFDEISTELIKRSRSSLVSAPLVSLTMLSSFFIPKYAAPRQIEGVGPVRSHHHHHHHHTYADDGGLSSDSGISDDEGEFTNPHESTPPTSKPILDMRIPTKPPQFVVHAPSPSPPTPTPGNLPISSFFTRFDKNAHHDEITIEQAILCLEAELRRPRVRRRY